MSNVISFLERMGQDAGLREAGPADLNRAMMRESLDEPARTAILGKDQAKLEALLETKENVCLIYVDDAQ